MTNRHLYTVVVSSCMLLSGCGGSDKAAPPPPGPAIVDNVFFSAGLATNSAIATINHAGYIRAYGTGTDRQLTVGLGAMPMTGNAVTAIGNGWLPSSATFVNGNATLTANPGGSTYTLKVQGANINASDSTLAMTSILVKPTLASLAGTFGLGSWDQIVIAGNSFSGTYAMNCSWSGTLTPQTNTIDVTGIVFETATSINNPAGNACPYTGKVFTGTAYLLGSSAAYAKGTLTMQWDDGGANMPTQVQTMNFPRQ